MSPVSSHRIGEDDVVIRRATPADVDALHRLAALDSARPLAGAVLVAESEGAVAAAYSLDEQRAIADPFRPSADLVALLEARAARLREAEPRGARRLRRLRVLPARS
jgi:hypothetical protein